MAEFQVRTQTTAPEIIGVTEVKPKNQTSEIKKEEYSMEGYELFHANMENRTGRGILLYVRSLLKVKEVILESNFEENIFVEMRLRNNNKLLIGCIYRSDSGTQQNNNNLNKLIREASTKGYSHILLMGDFNYREIDWRTWTSKKDDPEIEENIFLETLKQNNLSQHVTKPTRVRGTDKPSTLDLVITNEVNMVSDVEYHSPLGKSDHSVLLFNYQCYTVIKRPE